MLKISQNENRIDFEGELSFSEVKQAYDTLQKIIKITNQDLIFDLEKISKIDSSGVAFLDIAREKLKSKNLELKIFNTSQDIQEVIQTFSAGKVALNLQVKKDGFLESIGDSFYGFIQNLENLLYLISDIFFWSIVGIFNRKGARKDSFIQQAVLIGVNSVPILGLISLLIGLILALQSAEQLRQFGANIYVADLIAVSMTREMGPLITAIILSGRSGSAIASEVATMVVTEELDALKTMGINPVRYVYVPKIHAITIVMPLLAILSIVIGIAGGFLIGYFYLDLSFNAYLKETLSVLYLKDFVTGILKSIAFAWIIVISGCFYGSIVRGGAEGVGKATTASVVASIFMVILADSLFSLIFYF
ncbi:MAG: MlaE family lipid ABC transporter permease subunit [Calditrichaeota bacterium]|nr:MAG: MlaE family lipid ABC transporter permease subunit [Calditrichota bacterium]